MNYKLRIKEIRKSKGISQHELAERINNQQQNISKYELGTQEPTLSKLVEIAKVLDVSLDDLIEFKKIHSEYSKELSNKFNK